LAHRGGFDAALSQSPSANTCFEQMDGQQSFVGVARFGNLLSPHFGALVELHNFSLAWFVCR
jgi:hypothetical protein